MENNKTQASLDDTLNKHIKGLVRFIFGKTGIYILVGIFFLVIIILAFSADSSTYFDGGKDSTEKKLARIISSMDGVEYAEVMINYDYVQSEVVSKNNNQLYGVNYAIWDNKLKSDKKQITGVIVSAKGADDYMVKINIINAVKTGLDIGVDKVEVITMK